MIFLIAKLNLSVDDKALQADIRLTDQQTTGGEKAVEFIQEFLSTIGVLGASGIGILAFFSGLLGFAVYGLLGL